MNHNHRFIQFIRFYLIIYGFWHLRNVQIYGETNILQDGTLIDLCGATLLWRSAEGLKNSPVWLHLIEHLRFDWANI